MKRKAGRILSALLAITLALNLSQVNVFAAGAGQENGTISTQPEDLSGGAAQPRTPEDEGLTVQPEESGSIATESGEVEITGTGPVGDMVAVALTEEEERMGEDSAVSSIMVDGAEAVVAYKAAKEANLVVAVYEEGSKQMLASGKVSVEKGEGTVSVGLTGGLPRYFIVSAYLLDQGSHAPLCDSYVSDLYTEGMQKFMDMTADDFPEQQVLNLDESKESNFVVYNGSTVVIGYQPGMNHVTEQGDGSYVVENASTEFTSRKAGDSVAYTKEDGTVLLLKIKNIQVNGSIVTITEEENVALEDMFDYVKIEGGYQQESVGRAAVDFEDSSHSTTKAFSWTKTLGAGAVSATLKATGSLVVAPYVKVYLALSSQHVEFTLTFSASFDCSASGTVSRQTVDLLGSPLAVAPAPGVTVSFLPQMEFEASGQCNFSAKMVASAGFSCDNANGFVNKSSKPQLTQCDFRIEATVYLGLRLKPGIQVAFCGIEAGSASLDAQVGTQIIGKMNFSGVKGNVSHLCKACIAGELVGDMKVDGTISLLFIGSKSATIWNSSSKLSDFYYSIDRKEFGWRTCPYIAYKITLVAVDSNKNPVPNAKVSGTGLDPAPVTDSAGKAECYLKNGSYTLRIDTGDLRGQAELEVQDTAKNVEIKLEGISVIASGTCGAGLEWKLDDGGVLAVSGTGDMTSWGSGREVPWFAHRQKIISVVLEKGVTSIGACAFDGYGNLTDIAIPEGVTYIDKYTFRGCGSLKEINLPEGITSIGEYAFEGCNSLTAVELPKGLLYIDKGAFLNCKGVQELAIPDTVVNTAVSAFQGCDHLLHAEIESGTIDANAFQGCTSLVTAKLGSGVNGNLGDSAFAGCTSLTSIVIPDNVVRLQGNVCNGCTSLRSVGLGSGLTYIGDGSFNGCTRLSAVTIPDGVTDIGSGAFENCSSLISLTLGNHVKNIGFGTFAGCSRLGSVDFPASVENIFGVAFSGCTGLNSIRFIGDQPNITRYSANDVYRPSFSGCTLKAYYPADNSTWKEVPRDIGATVTWIPYSSITVQSDTEDQLNTESESTGQSGESAEEPGSSAEQPKDNAGQPEAPAEQQQPEEPTGQPEATTGQLEEPAGNSEPATESGGSMEESGIATESGGTAEESGIATESGGTAEESGTFTKEAGNRLEGLGNAVNQQKESVIPTPRYAGLPLRKGIAAQALPASTAKATPNQPKTAQFSGLSVGKPYVLLVVKDKNSQDLLLPENLLYIAQGIADQNGGISFSYIPRTEEPGQAGVFGEGRTDFPAAGSGGNSGTGTGGGSGTGAGGSNIGSGNGAGGESGNGSGGTSGSGTDGGTGSSGAIAKKAIKGCTITISGNAYTYDGSPKKPEVTVKDGSAILKLGADYTVSYQDNINAGTASINLKGAGNYTGTATAHFTIQKAKNKITAPNYKRTASGKAQSFSIKAKSQGKASLSYQSSQKKLVKVSSKGKVTIAKNFVGSAKITITAKATQNYQKATKKITVTVNPKKVKLTGVKNKKGRKLDLRWTKNGKADGYQIQFSTDKKFKKNTRLLKVAGAKKVTKTISKLKKGATYYVCIRTYKKVSKKLYYSGWSKARKASVKK